MRVSIEICYNNRNYIWIQGAGILDRELEKVETEKALRIIEFVAKQGIIINEQKGEVKFDLNR